MLARLAAYNVDSFVDILPAPSEWAWGGPFNDSPTLTVSYSKYLARGGLVGQLLDQQYDLALQFDYGDGIWREPPNSRFLVLEDSADVSDINGMVRLTCPGVDYDLTGVVNIKGAGINKDTQKRRFNNATVGTYLRTMLNEAQAEGLATAIKIDFTNTRDSAGQAWASTVTMELGPEVTMRQLLDSLSNQIMCDWRFEGNTLRVFNPNTAMKRDRKTVTLALGRECQDGPQARSTRDRVNNVLVVGEDDRRWTRSRASTHRRGGRGAVLLQGGVTQQGTAYQLADAALEAGGIVRQQLTRTLDLDAVEGFVPLRDYVPGDMIYGPGFNGTIEELRVYQITLASDADGKLSGNVVLNDRFVDRQIRQSKRVDGILGGSTLSGVSNAKPVPAPSKRKPAKVSPGVTTNAYITNSGNATSIAYVAWLPVTTDANGDEVDVVEYEVRARRVQ